MKVNDPKFDDKGVLTRCEECPFTSEDGNILQKYCKAGPHSKAKRLKFECVSACPTADTYQEAVELAKRVTSEGR